MLNTEYMNCLHLSLMQIQFPLLSCMGTLVPHLSFPTITAGLMLSGLFWSFIIQGEILWSFIKQNFLWPLTFMESFKDNCQLAIDNVGNGSYKQLAAGSPAATSPC